MEVGNETVLKKPKYKLNYILDKKGMQLVDTSAVYIYAETENSFGTVRTYLKFDSNGYITEAIKFYEDEISLQDFQVHPNSVKRGKYELLEGNRIRLELFYPGEPVPFTDGWLRIIRKGEIVGDIIKVKSDYGVIHNYIKVKNWK